MNYTVYAALREDINTGWIWITNPAVASRSVVRVLNRENGKTVLCEALAIDANFLEIYNQSPRLSIPVGTNAVVLNDWYRKKLGSIPTQSSADLIISVEDNLCGRIRACTNHPQIVVRLATWLGVIGVILGVVGFGLWILSLRGAP